MQDLILTAADMSLASGGSGVRQNHSMLASLLGVVEWGQKCQIPSLTEYAQETVLNLQIGNRQIQLLDSLSQITFPNHPPVQCPFECGKQLLESKKARTVATEDSPMTVDLSSGHLAMPAICLL